MQAFSREGLMQRGDGPNKRRRREALGGSGDMLPWEIFKITLSKIAFRVF